MTHYLDTGILLKLYTGEPESPAVRRFVVEVGQPLPFHALHRSECASALHLKACRGECSIAQANRALEDIAEDLRSGILRALLPDWEAVWQRCFGLARSHAAVTGCRTLDTLHVATALEMGFRRLVTSDTRQATLAERVGMIPINPT